MAQIPTKTRDTVHQRSRGRCERCGQRKPLEMSHRIAKGMGGSRRGQGNPALYAHLCHGCHAWVEAQPIKAQLGGWKVAGWEDLETWPIDSYVGLLYLSKDGTYEF